MAKFKNDNLDLETGENIDFDDADTIKMGYDGAELYINSTVSGVRAAQPYHMVRYDQLTQASGTLQNQIDNISSPTSSSGTMYPVSYVESEAISSTTSTTYQHKVTLSGTVATEGEHIVLWFYEWNYTNGNFYFEARVHFDNTTDLMNQFESPATVDSWAIVSGFKRLTLSPGIHTFDLEFASSQLGKTASMRKARLELWRLT